MEISTGPENRDKADAENRHLQPTGFARAEFMTLWPARVLVAAFCQIHDAV